MAVIHNTSLKPTKLELLTAWLPGRPWYRGEGGPVLVKAGGFRLDDPAGEVGIEVIVVTDTAGPRATTYLVPLTYRGAPLDGARDALVGTMEHGVLGRRWAYDAGHDPVFAAQLLALVEGRVQAQDQNASDRPDPEVTRAHTGHGDPAADAIVPTAPGPVGTAADDRDGTRLPAPQGAGLRLHRVLEPSPVTAADRSTTLPPGATGYVAGAWQAPDGSRVRGLFAVLSTDGTA
ncbi:maltokinase N-terminal cap-like domain-containing protein [Streptomyces subrutilus]|uniref:maltokinase N-terminal cap-like domain-containing protein n=1 Tax=Streptomyces subrutilus TaxID=36818 RepID=UPI002E0DDD72|nr:1,4-alpha-glucan branching protein [Streptomyces subrutilus]